MPRANAISFWRVGRRTSLRVWISAVSASPCGSVQRRPRRTRGLPGKERAGSAQRFHGAVGLAQTLAFLEKNALPLCRRPAGTI